MSFKNPCIVFCFMLISSLKANDTTQMVYLSELDYNSPLEKELVEGFFLDNRKDYIGLFLALDNTITEQDMLGAKEKFAGHIKTFQTRKFIKASPKKKIKKLYQHIHENYFTKYEVIAFFNEIFSSGRFNCVTATALYGIYMDSLGIPFTIRETPVHTYIVAYPMTGNILVETTDPQSRVIDYDYRTKHSYVEHLISNKTATVEELEALGIDGVFAKYFYPDGEISLDQLIGIHYMNHAAYLLDINQPRNAFEQLEKAYMFYPNDKLGFIMFVALSTIISNTNYEQNSDIGYFNKLPRYQHYDLTHDQIVGEFGRLTYFLLNGQNNDSLYTATYEKFMENIGQEALESEISYIYHYELGRYHLSMGDVAFGSMHSGKAFEKKPNNPDAMSLYMATLVVNIRGMGARQILDSLNKKSKQFPSLLKNNMFKTLLLEAYLVNANEQMQAGNMDEGLAFLDQFETAYPNNLQLPVSGPLIVEAYAGAAVYYFKKGNYEQSRHYLNKGLEYVPESKELQLRLMTF
jgi:tetratricopeptide (TPR) repeat protein